MTPVDPVREQRARIRRWVNLIKRIGYLGLLVAIVAFAVGLSAQFPSWTVTTAIAGLALSCLTLPAAVTIGYGLNNAERQDRAAGL